MPGEGNLQSFSLDSKYGGFPWRERELEREKERDRDRERVERDV